MNFWKKTVLDFPIISWYHVWYKRRDNETEGQWSLPFFGLILQVEERISHVVWFMIYETVTQSIRKSFGQLSKCSLSTNRFCETQNPLRETLTISKVQKRVNSGEWNGRPDVCWSNIPFILMVIINEISEWNIGIKREGLAILILMPFNWFSLMMIVVDDRK